ncbi:MAG: hypothetical protein GY913_27975 [Proteobacteria bacterium]|nr:hypothetical protein [Pseudomonadota bacterium]MCP4920749.1 hypothetical protein [Pseudomonadota bacterium]
MSLDVSSAAPTMDPAVDPFHPLIRLVDRYRRDVHALAAGASEDAIRAAERHLGHRLPLSLAGFLRRWNGGSLFRGALKLRASSELAPPDELSPGLVAFADLPGRRQWAYAPDGNGTFVFGEVIDGALVPLHDRFDRWLKGTLRLLDEDVPLGEQELSIRRECDPDGGNLLLALGERALISGDPERAMALFSKATAGDPSLIRAWQRLGEMQLADGERGQARFSLLKALRSSRMPRPFPGSPVIDVDALATLESLFEPGDPAWRRELETFLGERVGDVRADKGLELFEAAALSLARDAIARGARRDARDVLVQALERAKAFAHRALLADVLLILTRVERDLGQHDQAERRLRPLLREPEGELRSRACLELAAILVARQEPWAEDVLREARRGLTRLGDRARCHLMHGERHVLHQRLDEADAAFRAADGLAVQCGDAALQGAVCVGLGDVARLRGDLDAAAVAYRATHARAEEAHDLELTFRAVLRQGDLERAAGRPVEAGQAYAEAIEGYRSLDLPIREGWAWLRMARVTDGKNRKEALHRAREIFLDANIQLVAGIGACDALVGDPGHSLDWHLSCAAVHARERHEAQRARPPLTRADADRPERRLGAHRIAISAAGLDVVEALEKALTRAARELGAASSRATDPNVAAYVAAVDLLAYHRSYEAAQVLLRQLLEVRLPELPERALRGALARSPNAVLVDGLLEVLEGTAQPRGIAAAAEILGWRRETEAVGALRSLVRGTSSSMVRRAAVIALGRIGDPSATEDLLDILERPDLAEDVAIALLMLGDRRGVDFHGQALSSGTELANPPGEIVGRYGGPSYLLLLMGSAAGEGARARAALQGLGYLGDVRAIPRLLASLSHRDRSVVAVACGALALLTGHREDADEPGVHARWERWWEQNASSFTEGVRTRYGEPMSPTVLARKLGDDDPLVRRGAYDELVITTGCHLPFDADGPWRIQQMHRRAWLMWAQENEERFHPGRWWFSGDSIG